MKFAVCFCFMKAMNFLSGKVLPKQSGSNGFLKILNRVKKTSIDDMSDDQIWDAYLKQLGQFKKGFGSMVTRTCNKV